MTDYLRKLLVLLIAAYLNLPLSAASAIGWPDAVYDPRIPTQQAVLGAEPGERITPPEDLNRYFEALAEAAPDRTLLVEYARSWQGRSLNYLVIASPENLARLEDIKAGMQQLADPRGIDAGRIDSLIETMPALIWLAHGVHGNEISSPEAALVTAYHLLASDAGARLLEDTVVIIDPTENPDGRARFVQHYQSLSGIEAQGSPIAAERVEGWPSGRTNHYLFDMNRDWFAMTQPEVSGRVAAFLEFFPLVYVDLHEMGTNRTFYFPPPAQPYNPYLSEQQLRTYDSFGRHTGSRFDEFGFRYFTRETYDAYYPGYGDTWPTLQGSMGMTFEMASARGLLAHRADGSTLTYADGVQRHFVASIATIETAAEERVRLLQEFVEFRADSQTDEGFVLPRQGDIGRVDKLAALLIQQGIEVHQLAEATRVCGTRAPAGSYLISGEQPAGRLASTLLAADSPVAEAFWNEQERRVNKGLGAQIYDIIAWSLPSLWGVDVASCRLRNVDAPLASDVPDTVYPLPSKAAVAYLVPWGSQAAAGFLSAALRRDLVVESSVEGFTQNGREFIAGAVILRSRANDADLHQHVVELAGVTGAEVVATDTSWVDSGVNFGSDKVQRIPKPAVAIAWGEPAAISSAGSLRFVIEQKLGYPAVPVRPENLNSGYLDAFDVLLLPDGGGYADAFNKSTRDNLTRWVERGGTLIGIGGALELLGSDQLALLDTLPERRAGEGEDDSEEESEETSSHADGRILEDADELASVTTPLEENPPEILGAILNAQVDGEHWLSVGIPESVRLIVEGDAVFTPLRRNKGRNVVSFAPADELIASGHLWEDSRLQWALKPAVMATGVKRGIVIGFAADPSFRGYLDGLDVLIANAVFRGPSQAQPVRSP